MTGESHPMTEVKKKVSYVKSLIEKSKLLAQSSTDAAMSQSNVKKSKLGKRTYKKTLTVATPFELKTQKRVRLDISNEGEEERKPYEPLW